MLAEHLVEKTTVNVEILTTCALNAMSWENELDEASFDLHGVRVHRVLSEAGRGRDFHPFSGHLLRDPGGASIDDAHRWISLQGPKTDRLIEMVGDSDADVVAFYPYLYYPTVYGIGRVKGRAIMHPAAHDEPPLRLPIFKEVFSKSDGFVFQTKSERRLVYDRFPVGHVPQALIGLGVNESVGNRGTAQRACGIEGPYVLYIGRVDDKKGTGLLWRYFKEYKTRHPGPLKLVLVGQVVNNPDESDDIIATGMVDDETKWGLLRGASVYVSPSPWEAFSITVIEAMTATVPVMVNASCDATREHIERSRGGFLFHHFDDFELGLNVLLGDKRTKEVLCRRARAYVDANYTWETIIGRYQAFLERVAQ
jgi:glycosyltransferase involved in cell wall biosynthesis